MQLNNVCKLFKLNNTVCLHAENIKSKKQQAT